jgi:predicted nucleic acid-binding protein
MRVERLVLDTNVVISAVLSPLGYKSKDEDAS